MGHINMFLGHSDTGKTTAMIEAAVSAQNNGILPVFIITEMKWNWEHAQQMGLQVDEVVDKETGEIIKQIPEEDFLRLTNRISDFNKNILDQTV